MIKTFKMWWKRRFGDLELPPFEAEMKYYGTIQMTPAVVEYLKRGDSTAVDVMKSEFEAVGINSILDLDGVYFMVGGFGDPTYTMRLYKRRQPV